MFKSAITELRRNKLHYLFLLLVLTIGLFVRVYRVDKLLGFYFDQGRDALVIWDLIHKGEFFLIGPTTGIAGIFRGPFYYYLIAPFYFLGQGNPVWPAIFLSVLSMVAVGFTYFLAKTQHSTSSGIFALIIGSLSFHLMLAGRWLSNPTPMLLLSVTLVVFMVFVAKGIKSAWYGISIVLGLSLFHFGSSGELFYFPALAFFAILYRRYLDKKVVIVSAFLFFLTFSPLLLFDILHNGILSTNIKNFLGSGESFRLDFWEVVNIRLNFYYKTFGSLLFDAKGKGEVGILVVIAGYFMLFLPKLLKNTLVQILLLLLASLTIGLIFFQGNDGNIYSYYLTGYFLIFVLLFSLVLGQMWKSTLGKVFVGVFFYLFLSQNIDMIWNRIRPREIGQQTILFENQKQAIDWIYEDLGDVDFNVDVYVPPVIPYAYDYLFTWYGGVIHSNEPRKEQRTVLYTLYEVDPPHPERLEAWLARQKGIGVVETEASFGGITVQRRKRIK